MDKPILLFKITFGDSNSFTTDGMYIISNDKIRFKAKLTYIRILKLTHQNQVSASFILQVWIHLLVG